MRATFQYLILTLFVCILAYAAVKPIADHIGASLRQSAELINNSRGL